MIRDALFNHTVIPLAGRGLDAAAMRSKAVANNLANVQTPGYHRIEVSFEERLQKAFEKNELQDALKRADHGQVGNPKPLDVHPIAYRAEDPIRTGELNNVDIDSEMAKLAEAQIQFSANAKVVGNQMEQIMLAVRSR